MQAEYIRKCSLCLVNETEVAPFLQHLKKSHPHVEMSLFPSVGTIQLIFQSDRSVDSLVHEVEKKFPTFFIGEGRIEDAVHREFIAHKKTLALAESCTGGAIAAKLTSIPGASKFFLGSVVAYSNAWKERFLQVSRTTLKQKGWASREVVREMVQGLLNETDADYGAAVSGFAGQENHTIYVAIGVRGQKIDAGVIHAPSDRSAAIDLTVHLTLGALWRRLVHHTATFS